MPQVLCRFDDIPDGGAISVDVESATGGFSLVLTRLGTTVHAFHNECPHAGRRLDWAPGKFLMEAGMLICAAHGAAFLRDSGACIGGPCRGQGLRSVPVVVEGGNVRLS
jgi:nitrite reductase/ring-hydroxylating ferredoxin subunit